MVKVSIRVRSGAACFDVAVSAESVERAMTLAGNRYTGSDILVRFPVIPESLSPNDAAARARVVGSKRSDAVAA